MVTKTVRRRVFNEVEERTDGMIIKLLLLQQSMLVTFCSLIVRPLTTKSTQTDSSSYRARITTAMTVFHLVLKLYN